MPHPHSFSKSNSLSTVSNAFLKCINTALVRHPWSIFRLIVSIKEIFRQIQSIDLYESHNEKGSIAPFNLTTWTHILIFFALSLFWSRTAVQIVERFYSYFQPDNVMFHSESVLSVFLHKRYQSDSYPVTNRLYWLLIQRFALSTELIR